MNRFKETRMRRTARTVFTAALLLGCAALVACGDKEQGGNKVQMKDMEVVDGTATDAMTDLDGVQSEGTAIALPSDNATGNGSTPAAKPAAEKARNEDAEILSDQ